MKVNFNRDEFVKLGDICKNQEAACTSEKLNQNLPIVARLDGHTFSKFCKGLKKPYDMRLSNLMQITAKCLQRKYNADLSYTQSDEITLVWKNLSNSPSLIFDGKCYKLMSLLASSATAFFNTKLPSVLPEKVNTMPEFDCRIWNVPDINSAYNVVVWRILDATRNSVSMCAQHYFSHKSLQGTSIPKMKKMLGDIGHSWSENPSFFRHGSVFIKDVVTTKFATVEMEILPEKHNARLNPELEFSRSVFVDISLDSLSDIRHIRDFMEK